MEITFWFVNKLIYLANVNWKLLNIEHAKKRILRKDKATLQNQVTLQRTIIKIFVFKLLL